MRLLRSSTSLIGLDMGNRIIKAAQLRRSRRGWRVNAVAILPRIAEQSAEQTAARITGVLERQGFSGERVVLAAPVRNVECEMLDLPPRGSGAPLEQIAMAELGRTSKLEPGRFEMGCWDVPAAARSNGTAVLALALRHQDADALIEPLELHGLEVVAIDAQACAMHRACRALLGDAGATAILDLGWSAASLHIAARQMVMYQRTLWDCGIEYVHKTIVAEHGLSEDAAQLVLCPQEPTRCGVTVPGWLPSLLRRFTDQLCDELHASFTFARQRFPEALGDQVLLTGGGASLPNLAAMLTERLGMKVSVPPAGELVDPGECSGSEKDSSLLMAALGLAMYGEES